MTGSLGLGVVGPGGKRQLKELSLGRSTGEGASPGDLAAGTGAG